MMMANWPQTSVCGLALASTTFMFALLALGWSAVEVSAGTLAIPNLASVFPQKSAKEIKMDFKVLLTHMKKPSVKARNERLLAKLYREERLLKKQIEDLNRNLGSVNDKQRRQGLRVLEIEKDTSSRKATNGGGGAGAGDEKPTRRNLVRVQELTQTRVDQWSAELKEKTLELEELRAKINESKNIIKHPDSYISVPSNYGRLDPEEVQDRERELLVRDRENMDYRRRIESGEEELPAFMADHW